MVLTVRRFVEIPQVHLLDKIVDILVCCATTGAHGLTSAENRSGSAITVHRQFRRHPCRCCATTGYHGPVCAETRDPTGAFLGNFVGPLLCDDRCPWSSVRDPWRFHRFRSCVPTYRPWRKLLRPEAGRAMYHSTSKWQRGPPPPGCLRMAHWSSADGPTGARTGGELSGSSLGPPRSKRGVIPGHSSCAGFAGAFCGWRTQSAVWEVVKIGESLP